MNDVVQNKKFLIDNFTGILPVTCNANCGFCPEKEMANKLKGDLWIRRFTQFINTTRHLGYDHISLSGGEPTINTALLGGTIDSVVANTHIQKIGITTNGLFLEKDSFVSKFLQATRLGDPNVHGPVNFINISRHRWSTEENNRVMGVNYKHTLGDIAEFKLRYLPGDFSFRINMVIDKDSYQKCFEEALNLRVWLATIGITVAFRIDYSEIDDTASKPMSSIILKAFKSVFGYAKKVSGCPTCETYQAVSNPQFLLKASFFEPLEHPDEYIREFIVHQDGNLYLDWKRNYPYNATGDIDITSSTLGWAGIDSTLDSQRVLTLKSVEARRDRLLSLETVDLSSSGRTVPRGCGSSGCGAPVNSRSCG